MSTKLPFLVSLLGSKTRADLIAFFVMHQGESFYIRQLAEILDQFPSPVLRELGNLERLGLVTSEMKANAKYYTLNQQALIFPELQSLVVKTAGLADVLKKALKPFDSLLFAFVYGSFASGEMGPKSDVDLFLIGSIPQLNLAKAMRSVQMKLGREIQYSIFNEDEVLRKLKKDDGFIRQIIRGPKIMAVGESSELERFAKTGSD